MPTTSQSRAARRIPLYQQAADALRDLILSGRFEGILPSQDALCDILQVSRPTVREAIRVLERTGLVHSRQGIGTVIDSSKPDFHPGLETLNSTTDLIRSRGYTSDTSHVEVHRAPAAKGMYPVFADLSVVTIERVRSADGVPLVYSIDVIPDNGYDLQQVRANAALRSFMTWLEAEGVHVSYAKTELTARPADRMLAEFLEVPRGTALLVMEEVGYSAQNEPVYMSNDFYRCDLVHFHVIRRRA